MGGVGLMVKVREECPIHSDGTPDLQIWAEKFQTILSSEFKPLFDEALKALSRLPARRQLTTVWAVDVLFELGVSPLFLSIPLLYAQDLEWRHSDPVSFRQQVRDRWGAEAHALLDGVVKMEAIAQLRRLKIGQSDPIVERLKNMLLAMADDIRVVIIKLAWVLAELKYAHNLSDEIRCRLGEEAQLIYAPLANRLGVGQIKWELEDLSFHYLQPDEYKRVASLLDGRRVDREEYIARVQQRLSEALTREGLHGEVTGRAKHIYSIWRKMKRKNLDYAQIYDIRAVRVLVGEVRDCYAVLGVVHSLWHHIPNEFDDYIATPKENGYRSLHTAVIDPEGKTLEVQIRTHQMHQDSELGIAAHWQYKEGRTQKTQDIAKMAWLRQLMDWQSEWTDIERLKDDWQSEMFSKRVYVLTPKGDLIDIPEGGTPLDFAYQVHTEIGHRCRGAKVNGHMVPLTHVLKTGDQVEILTIKSGAPSRDWMNPNAGYLKSSRARSKVHTWYRKQDFEKNVQDGREIMERELHRLKLAPIDYATLAGKLNLKTGDDVLAALGRGDLRLAHILNAADVWLTKSRPGMDLPVFSKPSGLSRKKQTQAIWVQGVGDLMTHLASCCQPVPGEKIIGYITQGRGVSIHRENCRNVWEQGEPDRLIEVSWGNAVASYPVTLKILAYERTGLLKDLMQIMTQFEINVTGMNSKVHPADHQMEIETMVEVKDFSSLIRLLERLSAVPNVVEARRIS